MAYDQYMTTHNAKPRASAHERGYNSRWRKARDTYLMSNPLCVECKRLKRMTRATVVDHIRPHKGDQKLFWDKNNWQSLCAPCHNSYKQRLEKSGTDTGCDASGMPLDAGHHWYAGEEHEWQ